MVVPKIEVTLIVYTEITIQVNAADFRSRRDWTRNLAGVRVATGPFARLVLIHLVC